MELNSIVHSSHKTNTCISHGIIDNNNCVPKPKKKLLLILEEDILETEIGEEKKGKKMNKGTGAGGKNTNFHGKKFEEITNNQLRLLKIGYNENLNLSNTFPKKTPFYLSKSFPDKTITFVLQNGLKTFMKNKYNISLFRCPDEAYIIEYYKDKDIGKNKKIIKVLEKKEQNVEGSVETKLWSGPSLKREYEILLGEKQFSVFYGFCVSNFLKQKLISEEPKYKILNQILKENHIEVLFGEDENYFEILDKWINNFL